MGSDRHLRRTKRFDSERLAVLARDASGELAVTELGEEADEAQTRRSRTATVHDPLTTELLAEVARRSQTMELTDESVDARDQAPAPPVATPRLVRRR